MVSWLVGWLVSWQRSSCPFLQIPIYNFWNSISDLFEQFCRDISHHWGGMLLSMRLCYSLNWEKGVLSGADISLFPLPLWNAFFLRFTEKFNVTPFDDLSLQNFIPKHTLFVFMYCLKCSWHRNSASDFQILLLF